jgi:hypothetical protein
LKVSLGISGASLSLTTTCRRDLDFVEASRADLKGRINRGMPGVDADGVLLELVGRHASCGRALHVAMSTV